MCFCITEPNLSENPATEQIVFALYKGEYYRAVVKDVRKDHVRVRFLDFGDSTNVSHKECKRACRKIMQVSKHSTRRKYLKTKKLETR